MYRINSLFTLAIYVISKRTGVRETRNKKRGCRKSLLTSSRVKPAMTRRYITTAPLKRLYILLNNARDTAKYANNRLRFPGEPDKATSRGFAPLPRFRRNGHNAAGYVVAYDYFITKDVHMPIHVFRRIDPRADLRQHA